MVDKSMSSKRKMVEGMYTIVLQVLHAIGETGTVKPEFPYDGLHIHHTMHELMTPEYASCWSGCGNTLTINRQRNALSAVGLARQIDSSSHQPA